MGETPIQSVQPDVLSMVPPKSEFSPMRLQKLGINEAELRPRIVALQTRATDLNFLVPERYIADGDFWAIVTGEVPKLAAKLTERIPDEAERQNAALDLALTVAESIKTAEDEAMTDPLTGLRSRRYLEDELTHLLAHRRGNLGVIMFDIDKFKDVNTIHGHPGGDSALQAVAEILKGMVRPGDTVARYGGEELVILLEELPDPMIASAKANEIRQRIADTSELVRAITGTFGVTVSAGVTIVRDSDRTPKDIYERLSEYVTRAKNIEGRNSVVDDFNVIDHVEYKEVEIEGKTREVIKSVKYKQDTPASI